MLKVSSFLLPSCTPRHGGAAVCHSPSEELSGSLQALATADKAAVNPHLWVSFHFSRADTQEWDRWSERECTFHFIRRCQTVSQGSCTVSLVCRRYLRYRILVASHPHQHLVTVFYLRPSRRCVVVCHSVLVCMFLMANDVDRFLMCLICHLHVFHELSVWSFAHLLIEL